MRKKTIFLTGLWSATEKRPWCNQSGQSSSAGEMNVPKFINSNVGVRYMDQGRKQWCATIENDIKARE